MSEVIEGGLALREEMMPAIAEPHQALPMLAVNLLPVAQMRDVLAEYTDRRREFRGWLLSQMREGVHFGVVPGCEFSLDPNGNMIVKVRGETKTVSKLQWQARPSLYKAGAQLIVDLLMLRAEFASDEAAWRMLGSSAGMVVTRCRLLYAGGPFFAGKAIGDVVGEGVGSFSNGMKGMDANSALKMAQKRAMVDAVINTLSIADLFTQDIEDAQPDKREQPAADQSAPQVKPRGERATGMADKLNALARLWATERNGGKVDLVPFVAWAKAKLATDADLSKPSQWTQDMLDAATEACR